METMLNLIPLLKMMIIMTMLVMILPLKIDTDIGGGNANNTEPEVRVDESRSAILNDHEDLVANDDEEQRYFTSR
jgi:hypothetical protein